MTNINRLADYTFQKYLHFNEKNLEYEFSLTAPDASISIGNIVIDSFTGQKPEVWGSKLTRLSPMLEITFHKLNGYMSEPAISLNACIGPMHYNAIIQLNETYPNRTDMYGIKQSCFDSCKVRIRHTTQDDVKLDIKLFYNVYAGYLISKPMNS